MTSTPDPDQPRRRRLHAPSPAMLVALTALFVALGGTGYAATRLLPPNSVGEHQLRNSAVTSSKIRPHTIHLSDIATSTRNSLRGQTGPQGPQGPTGPQGPPGAAIFHAAVDSGGAAVRGNATFSSGGGGTGTYTIGFARDVSGCEATATLGLCARRRHGRPARGTDHPAPERGPGRGAHLRRERGGARPAVQPDRRLLTTRRRATSPTARLFLGHDEPRGFRP